MAAALAVSSMSFLFFPSKKPVVPNNVPQEVFLSKENYFATPFEANLAIREPLFNDHTCAINDYGAVPGGKISNTAAFQKAIADCAKDGGGTVIVPLGTWLTGPIQLKNNIRLQVDKNAKVLFSDKFADYLPVVFSRFEGIEYYNYAPPIYAKDCKNVAVVGEGVLDGQGETWWKWENNNSINQIYGMGDDNVPLGQRVFGTPEAGIRPAFVEFINCNNVLVENVTLKNGPMWTIHPTYSKNVTIRGINVSTNPGPSTDGVAIDSCKDVLVENSTFNTGDDAIVLKSGRDKEGMRLHRPTENVVIRGNNIVDAHGAIAIGSETSGDVRNVFAFDNQIDTAQYGMRIKSALGRGGVVENIWTTGLKMRRISIDAIRLDAFYGTPFRPDSVAAPFFRNIYFENITAERTPHAITLKGTTDKKIDSVSFENINLTTRDAVEINNASNINFTNVNVTPRQKPLFNITDSTDINLTKTPCLASVKNCLTLNGSNNERINLAQSSFATSKKIQLQQGATKEALIIK